MSLAQRSAEHGHGILKAALMRDHDVGIAFHHYGRARSRDRFLRVVECVEETALLEQRRFGRVDVLRWAIVGNTRQYAAAEADGAPLRIANRKQDPTAKPIVVAGTVRPLTYKPGTDERARRELRLARLLHEPIPTVGRIAA